MSARSWIRRLVFIHPKGSVPTEPAETEANRPRRESCRRRMAVDDCAAFLTGMLAEYRLDHGGYVAPWEWTNLLAHGGEEELRRELAARHHRTSAPERQDPITAWRAARSYLVAELLGLVETCGPLDDLQRSVLVPLELDLAARLDVAQWRPNQWLLAVDAALSARRRRVLHAYPRDPHSPG